MKKKVIAVLLTVAMVLGLVACGNSGSSNSDSSSSESTSAEESTSTEESTSAKTDSKDDEEETEIQVFIAASLNNVMTELADMYKEEHPNVKITFNADSSGTLLTQIEEGYACDIFFAAAQKQMDQLQNDGLVVDGTRANVVNNQVVVVTRKDSGTKVTGLEDIVNASSIALAGGSVPVGKYTRLAMVSLGMIQETDDVSTITTEEISEQLGGVEISEQDNVSKVLAAVVEGSCEVGTTYYSDTYGYEDDLDILEKVSYDYTGNVIYPIAQVKNDEATDAETAAAADFVKFVLSDKSKAVFDSYYFDTNVE